MKIRHTSIAAARRGLSPLLLSLAVVVVVGSGCSNQVTGVAVKSGGPAPAAANAALLDPGHYPRRPRPPLGQRRR